MSITPTFVPGGYDNSLLDARVARAHDAAAELLDAARMLTGNHTLALVDAVDILVSVARAQGLPCPPAIDMSDADQDRFVGVNR